LRYGEDVGIRQWVVEGVCYFALDFGLLGMDTQKLRKDNDESGKGNSDSIQKQSKYYL